MLVSDYILAMAESSLNEFRGLMVADDAGQIAHINDKFSESLFKMPADEVIGSNLYQSISDNGLQEVLASSKSGQLIDRIWEINGRQVQVSLLPIMHNGQFRGTIVIGIFDYLQKITGLHTPEENISYYKEEIKRLWGAKYSFDSIMGNSLAIVEAKRQAWDIAATNYPVLITGETGTGKELFAHAIHNDSPHKNGPFIAVNCASIPENLVESELFGYEAGSFTGAQKGGKPGKFELANHGTIFLDEMSDLPIYMQAKLLRVLQEHEVERIGGTKVIPVDARVISASNQDLTALVQKGLFREDLYYRLNVFNVEVPALRERSEDIAGLSYFFISLFNNEVGTCIEGISDEALALMMRYNWPGNVRELKSTIERACLDAKTGLLQPVNLYYLQDRLRTERAEEESDTIMTISAARRQAERKVILQALEKADGNKKLACEMLDINRTTFYKKLKELDLFQD